MDVVALESIPATDGAVGDPAARLRAYLQAAYAGGTRYVLLGGDATTLPARQVIWRNVFFDDYLGQSDLYLACFDSEWDVDGDGAYDDFPATMDLVPELAVGRALVRNALQAQVFVDKVLTWEASASQPYRRRALFMDTVAYPTDWVPGDPALLDFAEVTEQTLLPLFAAASVEFDAVRLYQNFEAYPGAEFLSSESAATHLSSGEFGLVHLACRGNVGVCQVGLNGGIQDLMQLADWKDLATGGRCFFLQALTPYGATHGDETGFLLPLSQSPAGGCVGGVGFAGLQLCRLSVRAPGSLLVFGVRGRSARRRRVGRSIRLAALVW